MKGKEHDMLSIDRGPLSSIWALRMYANREGLLPFLLDQEPLTRFVRRSMPDRLWAPPPKEIKNDRKLLFDMGDWSFQCDTLQKPLHKIVQAFWTTVRFYERGPQNATLQPTNCSWDAGLTSCLGYSIPPSQSQSTKDTLFKRLSDVILYAPTMGMGADRVFDAMLSPMSYDETMDSDLVTGKRILYDMAVCNHTQLTMGTMKDRNFMAIFVAIVILFHIIATMCMPLSCCQWALWYFLFPVFFFWAVYNTSPLCWPMVPTSFFHDVNAQITYMLPQEMKIPKFLVKPECTLTGKLTDGSYDPACFSKCSDPPFLFVSWQDSVIWWICEASTEQCSRLGNYLASFGSFFNDLMSSADYYASVIKYSSNDPEFVQAHRICAIFSLYQIVFFIISVVITCYLLPIVLCGIVEVFMGCVVLLMDTYNAESTG